MTSIVTGAFGYIGKYIARRLLEQGEQVATITTHPDKPNPFGEQVKAYRYDFDRPDQLISHLSGATTLYNTYWVRFQHYGASFDQAVENTKTLFACAREAGIQKIVHISVTRATSASYLPYYAGKRLQEQALAESGVSYSIVRPTLVFGKEDILVNNIAWLIRQFPVFPIFGSGDYRVQPVFVEDLAAIAVGRARERQSLTLDAIGPEDYTFQEFVQQIIQAIKPSVKLIHLSPTLGIALGRLIGELLNDIILTPDELRGLMDNMLTSDQAPNGPTRFSDWLLANRQTIGGSYTSEKQRHFTWHKSDIV